MQIKTALEWKMSSFTQICTVRYGTLTMALLLLIEFRMQGVLRVNPL
jgi:hypothetical protein